MCVRVHFFFEAASLLLRIKTLYIRVSPTPAARLLSGLMSREKILTVKLDAAH